VNHADTVRISQLVARAKGGDREAFDGLVELYAPQVYNMALRVTGSREEAADCVQEAFVRAYVALRSFRGEAAFSTWLYRVALNVANDAAKRLARSPLVESDLSPDGADEPVDLERMGEPVGLPQAQSLRHREGSPDEVMLSRRRREVVLHAIRCLPQHHREVIILYDLQGLSYEEIAHITKTRVGTVKSRLNRARLALKDRLSPYLELLRS
jgi:RNA polymerase sigma-70 factor (ECF subfamily)